MDIASTVCDKGSVVPLIAMKNSWKEVYGLDIPYNILSIGMGCKKSDHIQITSGIINKPISMDNINTLLQNMERHTLKLLENEKHSLLFDDLSFKFKLLKSRGYVLAHTTGYTTSMIQPILYHWKKNHSYIPDLVIASDKVLNGRPSPDAINKCINELNLKPEECINIDDSIVGIKAGKNANIVSAGVYEYGSWLGSHLLKPEENLDIIHRDKFLNIKDLCNTTALVYPTTSKLLHNLLYGEYI